MPIYQYRCSRCGTYEVEQRITENSLKHKPECRASKCPKDSVRLISKVTPVFKGSGFYETDYRRKKMEDAKDN